MVEMDANTSNRSGNAGIGSAGVGGVPSRVKTLILGLAVIGVLTISGLGVGFNSFLQQVSSFNSDVTTSADGIVVLTGGRSRIADGSHLLKVGKAPRLLISGVNPTVSERQLRRQVSLDRELFDCCVAVGRIAANTVGNATETKEWVGEWNMSSIILVTSDYHMPRSLIELRTQLPELEVTPFAVKSDRFNVTDWWHDPHAARVIFAEYLKYLVAVLRPRGI